MSRIGRPCCTAPRQPLERAVAASYAAPYTRISWPPMGKRLEARWIYHLLSFRSRLRKGLAILHLPLFYTISPFSIRRNQFPIIIPLRSTTFSVGLIQSGNFRCTPVSYATLYFNNLYVSGLISAFSLERRQEQT